MLIKYYKNENLKYCNRKRYNDFKFLPFNTEIQKKVLVNDGAECQIKTSVSNICDYVIIDETRWFVTSYVYINGLQVELYLQRDVIGEFGISGITGKVERGYTETVLRNRKELSFNEILKDRKMLKPSTYTYGNYTVDNHNNEMWGVLYLTKPNGINPITNELYNDKLNIIIPKFSPKSVNYPPIDNGKNLFVSNKFLIEYVLNMNIRFYNKNSYSPYIYRVKYFSLENTINCNNIIFVSSLEKTNGFGLNGEGYISFNLGINEDFNNLKRFLDNAFLNFNKFDNNNNNTFLFTSFPNITDKYIEDLPYDYNNIINLENSNELHKYTVSERYSKFYYGVTNLDNFDNYLSSIVNVSYKYLDNKSCSIINLNKKGTYVNTSNLIITRFRTINNVLLSPSESGSLQIDTSIQLIDEPYSVLLFPLFDVKITSSLDGSTYYIEKSNAFMIFNTVINSLSGENSYLVDAQIYPYCPLLTNISTFINNYPVFNISSNHYNHYCKIDLKPYNDIKKEYMSRSYSLISPDKSSKFIFNFYDYKLKNEKIDVIIKTCLKPFSLISSAIIKPDVNSMKGIAYDSDMSGSNSNGSGYECSLSSNAFETYKRQNSNYQSIFGLEKEQLQMSHKVEQVNEITSLVVNTVTAGAMGAIGGSALTDFGFGSKAAGAVIGGTSAATTVGLAMGYQLAQNNKLREKETEWQQQSFDLQIGTIKNLPNSVNRISSFNEIIMSDFFFIIETYECSEAELEIIDNYINSFSYGLGVIGNISNYHKNGWFLRSTVIRSDLNVNLELIASKELRGGIYLYE